MKCAGFVYIYIACGEIDNVLIGVEALCARCGSSTFNGIFERRSVRVRWIGDVEVMFGRFMPVVES